MIVDLTEMKNLQYLWYQWSRELKYFDQTSVYSEVIRGHYS
jgi:hypothetical protein